MNKKVKQGLSLGLALGTSILLIKLIKSHTKKETYVVSVNFDED